MLRKDDVVYYKVKLKELFKQADLNGIDIKLDINEVSFIDKRTKERATVKPMINNNLLEIALKEVFIKTNDSGNVRVLKANK